MTNEELIEKVASIISAPTIQYDLHYIVGLTKKSEHIISTILTALQEPTSEMIIAGGNYVLSVGSIDCMHVDDRPEYGMTGRETGSYALFQAMLNASPLAGEKRGAE